MSALWRTKAALRQVSYFLVSIIPPVYFIHSPATDRVYQQLIALSNTTHFRDTRTAYHPKTKPQQSYPILQKTRACREKTTGFTNDHSYVLNVLNYNNNIYLTAIGLSPFCRNSCRTFPVEEESFYQHTGLKFEEETSKMLHLEHGFVWC